MKYKLFIALSCTTLVVNATGLAVSLNNLYIENQDKVNIKITVPNLASDKNKFIIPAGTVCKINTPIMFLPANDSSNNFDYVITLESIKTTNSIVIDNEGLALASYSKIKSKYMGNVKNYNLLGYCEDKLSQRKNLFVIPHDNESSMPDFRLTKCTSDSNFVYVINDNIPDKVTKYNQTISIPTIKPCQQIESIN
jgi:hypothetical protein